MAVFLRHSLLPLDALPSTGEPDAVLVARARIDADAFAPLYVRYVEEVARFCYIRLDDEDAARDITQQIFARALVALPLYRERGQFRAWLYTIARRVLANAARDSHHDLSLEAARDIADPAPRPEEAAAVSLERRALLEALARLPDDQRTAIELRLAGLKGREIATVMGRSHDAVKKLQLRALEKLRHELRDLHGVEEGRHGS